VQRIERSKRMLQSIWDQINSKILTQSILISKIEIKLIKLINLCFDLSCSFFCSLLNKKFDTIVTKRKFQKFTKKKKEIIVIVKSISARFIETIYFENIVARVKFIKTLYFVVCFIA